ncbi:MAG: hypothetical protein KDD28_32235, partial [Phaeodactylibacter sp.]|nr:hypothetical protein [Phaeodactylibacter sp.]
GEFVGDDAGLNFGIFHFRVLNCFLNVYSSKMPGNQAVSRGDKAVGRIERAVCRIGGVSGFGEVTGGLTVYDWTKVAGM